MIKRLFDLIFSVVCLIILLPLFLFISLSIILGSKGGIFYTQLRVGKNNREFKLIKFRTMITGAERKGLLTIGESDNRITKTGLWLRKYKFDELPQLINIIKGDMSLVGPRPEVRKYVDFYTADQVKVLKVRPGLTDYASLEYINENKILSSFSDPEKGYIETIMPEKLRLNLKYIREQNLSTDLRIIFRTIKKILT